MVLSTPRDCEDFNHLTRLEEVVEDSRQIITASGRRFKRDLTSIDDISLEYGVLELRRKTPERLQRFRELQLDEMQRGLLRCIDWDSYVAGLDSAGVSVLVAAVNKIKGLVTEAKDHRPVKWLYFKSDMRPVWLPEGTVSIVETLQGDFCAEDAAGALKPLRKQLVETLLKHEVLAYCEPTLEPA